MARRGMTGPDGAWLCGARQDEPRADRARGQAGITPSELVPPHRKPRIEEADTTSSLDPA